MSAAQWTAGAAGTFEVRDPANGETVAWVAALDGGQTDSAIDAAAAALPGWRAKLPQERAAVLRRWSELILAAREDLALLMTLEQGKPLPESRGEIDYAASFVEWYAEEGKRLNAERRDQPSARRRDDGAARALGVVGVVTPWNFPSAMLTRKAAAALAAGCTVVAHPSSETPLSALALAELGERAGLPAGVVQRGDGRCRDDRRPAMPTTRACEP